MNEENAHKFLNVIGSEIQKFGFNQYLVLVALSEVKDMISFPYSINFDETLLIEFLYTFLKEEEHKDIRNKLFSKFMSGYNEECLNEFVKYVNI